MKNAIDKFSDWPAVLNPLKGILQQSGPSVTVAELLNESDEESRFERILSVGLVDLDEYSQLDPLHQVGYIVESSDISFPIAIPNHAHNPHFWIHSG
ncbi:MAG: hypothetical protein P1U42_00845, partial [Phycisphaerales bacterium]|nr:hypothetical protein [Phycisphaerales bacterium]